MITTRKTCRGCFSDDIHLFLNLGKMPLAGGFLTRDDFAREPKFPLKLYFCRNCGLVQVLDVVNSDLLFKQYNYVSSVISSLADHFKKYAAFLKRNYLTKKPAKILEFGSNDGVLLQYFKNEKNIESYGIDPSKNVSQLAIDKGFKIWVDYFNQNSAQKIIKEVGKFDVVTGSNVFAHMDDIHEIIEAAKTVLKPSGVMIVEVHYLMDLLNDFQYDTVYHEHMSYYSVSSLGNILALHGLKIIDAQRIPTHGGSIRVVSTFLESRKKVKPSVDELVQSEKKITLSHLKKFEQKVAKHRSKLINLLKKLKKDKKVIAGYGAAGRATILLNYCGIGPDILDYMVDVSPLRAGKFMPGVHVPIIKPEPARSQPPDYFLVTAWNYIDSILAQETDLVDKGVKFIVPFPKIKII